MTNSEHPVAVVTGAAHGIGKAIAMRLAYEGCNIAVSDVDFKNAEKTASEIQRAGREALAVKTDVSSLEQAQELVESVISKFGRLDILVNNAGITRDNLLMRMSEAEWDAVVSVNLKGTFNCIKAVTRSMMKQRHGKIINISSVVGVMGNVGQANYAASKAGIIGLTKSAAKELGARGIQVNAIAPGYIETDMTKDLPEAAKEAFINLIPLKRPGQPEDVANVVAFLCSADADYITGQVIHIDGGLLM